MEKALVAMSGGVDSSVAAYLTQQAGALCIGGMMRLYSSVLPGLDGSAGSTEDARLVAQRLDMDFHVFDATQEFRAQVVEPFVRCYEQGLTPNPCIECNRCLKFSHLLRQALELDCQYVVTGHYARIGFDKASGRYLLYRAADSTKDQSYFLACLTQQQLAHARFPLGALTKEQVRAIAQEQGFTNARKRDSQDICFIPDGDYRSFLERYTGSAYPVGDFLDLEGNVVGRHRGAVGYTLGQRKGLGLAMGAPVYVCAKDMARNTVTVGPDEALYGRTLRADRWNWIAFDRPDGPMRVMAKARSRHIPQPATLWPEDGGTARVEFDQPQRAITPGQAVVLYDGDLVLGSGTIL